MKWQPVTEGSLIDIEKKSLDGFHSLVVVVVCVEEV